ncbi:MAG: cytochrome c oxidase subunit II [Erythrobacter sp.]
MNRVPGKRDAGGDTEITGFVEPGHARTTRRVPRSCARTARLAATSAPLAAIAGCAGDYSALDPAGPAAERVEALWQAMLWGAAAILAGVMGAVLFAFAAAGREHRFSDRKVLAGWGILFPAVVLGALMGVAFLGGESLLARAGDKDDAIRVRAERWGWSFVYPGGERTEGVLHVPAGREFTVEVSSADVIHSFWVPRLGGKIDAVPGKTNDLTLMADRPGIHRGQCSEYCGIGHAHMNFEVHAHAPADYPTALAAADEQAIADPPPVLDRRAPPAGDTIRRWTDIVLDLLGIT